jgi:hypothetical protein
MMPAKKYPVRNALIIPFTLVVTFLLVLLVLAVFMRESFAERIFYTAVFMPALYIYLEAVSRKVIIDERGVVVHKLLRRKEVSWEDITHVGCVVMGKKVYILMTTVKGFFIISNVTSHFSALIQQLLDHLDPKKMEEETRNLIANPIHKVSDIVGLWIAAIAMSGIIIYKLIVL